MTFVNQQAAMLKEQSTTNKRQSVLIDEQSITVKQLLVTVEQQSITNDQQTTLIQNLRQENRVHVGFTLFKKETLEQVLRK